MTIHDLVTIHNAELDLTSEVKRESLSVWQAQGWTLVETPEKKPAKAPAVETPGVETPAEPSEGTVTVP